MSRLDRQVDEALRLAHGERPALAISSPISSRGRDGPTGRHDAVDEADPLGLRRRVRTRPVRISSLARAGPTTRGSRCVPPAPGRHREPDLRQPELRALRRDPQVAAQRQLEAAAQGVALDGRDRRHRQARPAASRRLTPARAGHGRRRRAAPRTRRRASRPRRPARPRPLTTTARTSPARPPRGSPAPHRSSSSSSSRDEVERRVDRAQLRDAPELEVDRARSRRRPEVGGEAHRARRVQPRVHRREVVGDPRPEAHLAEHVALDVDARRDLDQRRGRRPRSAKTARSVM